MGNEQNTIKSLLIMKNLNSIHNLLMLRKKSKCIPRVYKMKRGNSRYKWLLHWGTAFQSWAWRDLWGETCAQHWKEQKQNWTMPATSTFFIQVLSERPFLKEGFAKTLSCSITNFRWHFSEKSLSRWLPPRPAWFSLFIGFLLTLKSTHRIRILGEVPMLWAAAVK